MKKKNIFPRVEVVQRDDEVVALPPVNDENPALDTHNKLMKKMGLKMVPTPTIDTMMENERRYLENIYNQARPPEYNIEDAEYRGAQPRNIRVRVDQQTVNDLQAYHGVDVEQELVNAVNREANAAVDYYVNTVYPMPEPVNTISYQNLVYDNKLPTYNISVEFGGDTVFYTDNKWFLRITKKGEIKFNTEDFPNLTADAQAKAFLEALKRVTHMDGKQFTFDF